MPGPLVSLGGQPLSTHRVAGKLGQGRGGKTTFTETGTLTNSEGVVFDCDPGTYLIILADDFDRMVLAQATELAKAPVS
jgi:hypothetical protein